MANPFQQQTRQRKFIYTALILALFTGSLMHRRLVVEPEAENLQLRETSRGEVELTSSAIRLTLTGSRGLAVTLLWAKALEEQERHKWNEVELLVSSITKLQPYFITPWLFQSWNLAFNVAVECDKPRDKYYYVSRGLQLLAEGERRNQGRIDEATGQAKFPGNPDMRYNMGFYYQLKIGRSDEKNAMQCLLDMSNIDPVVRDPERFWTAGEYGRKVDSQVFEEFCRAYPRLVRRISDQLDYNTDRQVVGFLKDNQVLPSRYSRERTLDRKSLLEPPKKQFPVLPPQLDPSWPNPDSKDLSPEAFDVFLVSRTWYLYAQKPLPPPLPELESGEATYKPLQHRQPRYMAIMIFRGYPARAQAFIAEQLREEGWFDEEDGWLIKDWFGDKEVRVGTETKYHLGRAWQAAYRMYKDYGIRNGLYIPVDMRLKLEADAAEFRRKTGVLAGQVVAPRTEYRSGPLAPFYHAHQRLAIADKYRQTTNYDGRLYEAEAESDPVHTLPDGRGNLAVLAHKLYFQGLKLKQSGALPQALTRFEAAFPIWRDILLQYPNYSRNPMVQEEAYERQLKFIRLWQDERKGLLRPLTMGMAQLSAWPYPPWDRFLTEGQKIRIIPIRTFRGPLDQMLIFETPMPQAVKETLLVWSQAALPMPILGQSLPTRIDDSLVPYNGKTSTSVYPGQANLLLTAATFRREPPPNTAWRPLIDPGITESVRQRLRVNPAQAPAQADQKKK
jgi:hypothetical protein